MDEEKTHGIDAHIPSDTEGFDKKVTEMRRKPPVVSPEREELNMKFQLLTTRLGSYASFYIQNKDNGLGLESLAVLEHIQGTITSCTHVAFTEMLKEKLNKLAASLREYADCDYTSAIDRRTARSRIFKEAANALATSETELLERTLKNVEGYLKSLQEQFGITITAEAVRVNERKESPAATSSPGPTDQQSGA